MVNIFAFERPGKVVRNEDGIEPGSEGWVDVRLWTVADHPRCATLAAMMRGKAAVSCVVFFGQHFYGAEMPSKARTAKLVCLFNVVSLGNENETVAGGKLTEGLLYMGKELDLLIGDGLCEADDAGVLVWRNWMIGKLLKARDERLTKTLQAIATRSNRAALTLLSRSRTCSAV